MTRVRLLLLALTLLVHGTSHASDRHGAGGKDREVRSHAEGGGRNREEGEGNERVGVAGPGKGITELSARDGFKLSAEALKNFGLRYSRLNGGGPWVVPKSAVVHSVEETNLFRRRDGFFKRVDFRAEKSAGDRLTVDSGDLREGDEVVVMGLGFLRIAELAATGGIAHGHSH